MSTEETKPQQPQPQKVKPMEKLTTLPNGRTDPDLIIPMQDLNNPLPPEKEVSPTNRLQQVLMQTAADEVTVKLEQVIELIGEVKANEICVFYNAMRQAHHGRSRRNTIVSRSRRGKNQGMATFDRKELLQAIEDERGKLGGDAKPQGKANPDPERLAAAKKKAGVK